ncbi:uncharacterized endoplasmic reticulum membrane protein C16E8.02-like isoform X2 [Neltuma alba]|uniref:uncharacterized endoplasmic reticulum membrane protein C16E8.02-like isoform X2 n=1 Tax=Neltuma alba TaxID=207710 RepID=UPI0010A47021|nr:uncharacterized endoplasmic reticulum membrane protein C16E8.02-like isoform X2 [Prosopis alba]
MARTGLFNLEKHFAFYGAYHSNPINIAIHTLFVWPIFFSALLILYFVPPFFNIPNFEFSLFGYDVALVWNPGFAIAFVYSVSYARLDLKAGSLAALLCIICWVASCFVAGLLGFCLAWKVVLVIQLVCWTGQFIGHGVFEVLMSLSGSEGFHSIVREKFEADIKAWQENKQQLLS